MKIGWYRRRCSSESDCTLTPLPLSRRRLLQAGATVSLASLLSGCTFGERVAKLYRYRVALRIDGADYTFENAGRFSYSYAAAGATESVDYPMQAAARLPTGEIVLVRPPNLKWAIEAAVGGAQNWTIDNIQPLQAAPYLEPQRPRVYIFDSATAPSSVEAYLMPLGLDGRARVEFIGQANEFTDSEAWQTQASVFPWYAACEPHFRYRGGYSTDTASSSTRPEPQPDLWTWIIQLIPEPPRVAFTLSGLGLPIEFKEVVEALNRGERVDIPLQMSTDGECKLSLAPNLSVAIGHRLSQADLEQLRSAGCPVRATSDQFADAKFVGEMFKHLKLPLVGDLSFGSIPSAITAADGSAISVQSHNVRLKLAEPTRENDSRSYPVRPEPALAAHIFQAL